MRDSPGVALLGYGFSRGIKNIVVLAGTLAPLHTASSAVVQQAFGTHATALALLTGLRGQTAIQSVSIDKCEFYFFIYLEFMSMSDHSLTQSLS